MDGWMERDIGRVKGGEGARRMGVWADGLFPRHRLIVSAHTTFWLAHLSVLRGWVDGFHGTQLRWC